MRNEDDVGGFPCWKEKLLMNGRKIIRINRTKYNASMVVGLWTGQLDILFEFLAFINSRVESINFTMDVVSIRMPTNVAKHGNREI